MLLRAEQMLKARLFVAGQLILIACVLAGRWLETKFALRMPMMLPNAICWSSGFIFCIGAVLMVLAARRLGKTLTPNPVPRDSGELTTTGLYSFCRHPIYLALILLIVGWSGFTSSWMSVAFTILLVWLLREKAIFEEGLLLEKYGEAYREYCGRVGRFWPWVQGRKI